MSASGTSNRTRETTSRKTSSRKRHGLQGGSKEANRTVVAILEVLGGLRAPSEAAAALNVSLPRYYILETRALEGMVAACEPKPLGKQPSLETRIAILEKELKQAHRQCARQQALVRAAQRSVGLSVAETQKKKVSPKRDHKGRKRRSPTVRALKAADTLRTRVVSPETTEVQQSEPEATPDAGRKEGQNASN